MLTSLFLTGQEYAGKYGIAEDERNTLRILEIGSKAPDIETENFSLSQAVKEGPVVLIFYRGYWCPYCVRNLEEFEENLDQIRKRGARVVAVTPEGGEGAEKMKNKAEWSSTIVQDADHSIMTDYGVLFKVSEKYDRKIRLLLFTDIAEVNDDDESFLPIPAAYVIDQEQRVTYIHYDANYKKRASVEDILQAVERM